jgi:hypothetical protein
LCVLLAPQGSAQCLAPSVNPIGDLDTELPATLASSRSDSARNRGPGLRSGPGAAYAAGGLAGQLDAGGHAGRTDPAGGMVRGRPSDALQDLVGVVDIGLTDATRLASNTHCQQLACIVHSKRRCHCMCQG